MTTLIYDVTCMVEEICDDSYCTQTNASGHTHVKRKKGYLSGENIFEALKILTVGPIVRIVDLINVEYIGEENKLNPIY